MTKEEIRKEIEDLRRRISEANHAYYDLQNPSMGDADYDKLEARLLLLERENPEFADSSSPVQNVAGGVSEGFAKVKHDPPMQSLDKTHSKGELRDFDEFLHRELGDVEWEYVVEPKVDGLSLSLRYENGFLTRAATRGNGLIGDDITANIRTIPTLPHRLPPSAPNLVEVRGEVYMTREGFVELNSQLDACGKETFANPRNAAAGSIKQKNAHDVAKRPLDFVIYNAGGVGCENFLLHTDMIKAFRSWGFPMAPWQKVCKSMDDVFLAIDELQGLRHSFRFEIDGAVIKVNQRHLYAHLGATAHGPRWARAYKYPPERAETILHQITVQVGRTGILTPVAELIPVFLAGSTISRATLHNADEIEHHDFRIGDHVWIAKAGDVIPAVESVIFEKRSGLERKFSMPTACPECGARVVRESGEVAVRCSNPGCRARLIERLSHFSSRNALDISQVGESVVVALVRSHLVNDVLDIFDVSKKQWEELNISDDPTIVRNLVSRATLVSVEKHNADAARFAEQRKNGVSDMVIAESYLAKSKKRLELLRCGKIKADDIVSEALEIQFTTADKIMSRLGDIKSFTLDRWLFAIGIPNVGVTVAKDIAAEHDRFSELPESAVLRNVIANDELKGKDRKILPIKVEAAKAVLAFFESDYGKAFAGRMKDLGIDPVRAAKAAVATTGPLAGAGCVLTGSLSRPRTEYAKLIERAGGIVQSAVTSKTKYLIAGANVGATKTEKARALGTEVIDEAKLLEMLAFSQNSNAEFSVTTPPKTTQTPQQGELF